MDAGGVRDEAVLARMAAHILRGLAYLHAHHQLHRDIKVRVCLRIRACLL